MVRREDFTENETAVKEGINNLNNVILNIEDIKTRIDNQIEFIPINNNKKDQLGENVEQYVNEISQRLESDTIVKLQSVVDDKSMMKKAKEMDNARYLARVKEEKLLKAKKEQDDEIIKLW